jgi:predicted phosphodiesterase
MKKVDPTIFSRLRRIFSSVLLCLLAFSIPASALEWSDESFPVSAWPKGPGPLGFGSPNARTTLPAGHYSYYFRTLFFLPSSEETPLDQLKITIHCSEGVIVTIHNTETGRSASLPPGDLPYNQAASFYDEDGLQEFDFTWLLSACENGLRDNFRTVAVEIHRVDPAAAEFLFDAEITGIDGITSYQLLPLQSSWSYFDQLSAPGTIPVKYLDKILFPMTGMPAIKAPGGDLLARCTSTVDPLRTRFLLAGANAAYMLEPISYERLVSGDLNITSRLPGDAVPGTYDLAILDENGIADRAYRAVAVLPALDGNLSAIHMTDSHLPWRGWWSPDNTGLLLDALAGIDAMGADIVIHTGDIYNESNALDQAEMAHHLLENVDFPVLYVTGNHELGEWCGDGSSRIHSWELFGWPRLNPERDDHYAERTRDYTVDIGPLSFIFLESWVNYTDYWRNYYHTVSFLYEQLQWLQNEALVRQNQSELVLCYHEDFDDELWGLLPGLGVDLALSGHTHTASEETDSGVLYLKTGATYSDPRPLRWLRFENGTLTQYPILAANAIEASLPGYVPGQSYELAIQVENHDYRDLYGLKKWLLMAPDARYAIEGGEKIGEWPAIGGKWVGIEYEIGGFSSKTIEVRPDAGLPNLSFYLTASRPVCYAGEEFRLSANLVERHYEHPVSVYVALEIDGIFFFWPGWSAAPEDLTFTLPAGEYHDIEILDFTWPDSTLMGMVMRFYGILVDPGSGLPLTPMSQLEVIS